MKLHRSLRAKPDKTNIIQGIGMTMRRFALAGILLCMSASGMANDSPIKADSPRNYKVEKGDTLWDISTAFLKSPWLWPEIWHANPQIKNPHLIFPNDVVSLVYIDGKPRIMVSSRGSNSNTIRLSPRVKVMPGEMAIPAIPLSTIRSYLKDGHVFSDKKQLNSTPYVFSAKGGKTVSGEGDTVYARGHFSKHTITYDVVRPGQKIMDPQTNELLGVIGVNVGTINLKRVKDDIASVVITDSKKEVKPGDRLLREQSNGLVTTFFPKLPVKPIDGVITANFNKANKISKFDTIVVNKGARESLKQGDVLAIYRKKEKANDPFTGKKVSLPSQRVGLVMIYRPFEKMSYGIVLSAKEDIEVGYTLRNPQP